jgi:hypothetical protein
MNTPPHHINPEVQLPPATHTGTVEHPLYPSSTPVMQWPSSEGPANVVPSGLNQLAAALAKAQGEMKAAVFNKVNPHFKNKYADLAAVLDAVRGPLSKNGLSVTQTMRMNGEGFFLTTMLCHASGQWLSSDYPLPVNAKPQELGSALTYARRYSLSAITGIAADEDDDAEAAQKADEKVNPEQLEHLELLVKETGTDVVKFLGYMSKLTKQNIKELYDIPASQFPTAFAALSKKAKTELTKS